MPRPSPREEQYLKPPSEPTDELEESGESKQELFSEDEPSPEIPEQSESSGQKSSEEQLLAKLEHNLEIEEFHFKSESSPEEEEPECPTAQYLNNSQ
jgi:hypothetical protein